MSQPSKFSTDREAEAKFIQKRVVNVEKYFGLICDIVGSLTRKNARLRDKGDLLARHLASFAESDELNPSTHKNLLLFAQNYAAVQDYHHVKVQRLETKVLKPLTRYGEICRFVKRNVKSEITVCGKEKKVAEKLEKLQLKTDDRSKLAKVELQLDRVQGEENLVGEAMEMEVDKFEKEKIVDIKTILGEMVKIEMVYHAKALEYLSKCFENIQQIDVDSDLNAFRDALDAMGGMNRGDTSARSQKSVQKVRVDASTLTSTGRSSDTRGSGTLSGFSNSTLSSTNHSRLSQRVQRSLSTNQRPPSAQPQSRIQPSPRPSLQSRPSPRVRISSSMYGDAEDDETDEEDECD